MHRLVRKSLVALVQLASKRARTLGSLCLETDLRVDAAAAAVKRVGVFASSAAALFAAERLLLLRLVQSD